MTMYSTAASRASASRAFSSIPPPPENAIPSDPYAKSRRAARCLGRAAVRARSADVCAVGPRNGVTERSEAQPRNEPDRCRDQNHKRDEADLSLNGDDVGVDD